MRATARAGIAIVVVAYAALLPRAAADGAVRAVLEAATPRGAPLGAAGALTLRGAGFAATPGGGDSCAFGPVAEAGGAFAALATTAAAVLSADEATCALPAGAGLGAGVYEVRLTLDGGAHVVPPLFDAVSVELYETSALRVDALHPPAGPVGGGTVVTLSGAGFAEYGEGQLCCVLPAVDPLACAAAATLLPELGGASRARCTLPAAPDGAPTTLALELSLNGAAAGSTSASARQFAYYAEPSVTGLIGGESGPFGSGTAVVGSGFDALDALGLTPLLRVAFGTNVAPAPSAVTSEQILLNTPLQGAQGAAAVRVALNGQQFAPAASGVSYTFIGVHAPVLLRARFSDDATALRLEFDAQPTDRARMGAGLSACSAVLDDDSVALVRGGAASAPLCSWASDTVLVVQLTPATSIAPGSILAVRDGVLAPASCSPACDEADLGVGLRAAVDVDAPCGPEAPCPVPAAALSAPAMLSACANETVRLDASASSGAGIKPLAYAWAVDRSVSDAPEAEVAAVEAQLAALPPAASVASLTMPAGGSVWGFALRVSSFLGATSEPAFWALPRSAAPSPQLSIDGPAVRSVRAAAAVSVVADLRLALCWPAALGSEVSYAWEVLNVTHTASGQPAAPGAALLPDLSAARTAEALLPKFSTSAGYAYTLRATATMAAQPAARAAASVQLRVVQQPLRAVIAGGDRRVGASEPLAIDASASADPDVSGGGAATLGYSWRWIAPTDKGLGASAAADESVGAALADAAAGASTSTFALPALTLEVGREYALQLAVSKPGRAPAHAAVSLTVVAGSVPAIVFAPLAESVYLAEYRLPTSPRLAISTSLDPASAALAASGVLTYSYAWRAMLVGAGGALADAAVDLADDAAVTTTGAAGPSLAFRSGALTPGALYAFELTVSGADQPAVASVRVQIHQPPSGGLVSVSPAAGVALKTPFDLGTTEWVLGSADAGPLAFTFSHALRAGAGSGALLLTPYEPLGGERAAPWLYSAVLPAGNRSVGARACDALGACGFASAGASVAPLRDEEREQALTDGAAAAEGAAASGLPAAAYQLVRALAEELTRAAPNRTAGAGGAAAVDGNTLVELSALAAAAGGGSTSEARAQVASVLATVLGSGGAASLGGSALASGAAQVANVSAAAVETGLEGDALGSLVNAIDGALGGALASETGLSPSETEAIGRSISLMSASLGRALLAGALSGEAAAHAVGESLNVTSARRRAAELADATLAGAGGVGAVSVSAAAVELAASSLAEGEDLSVVLWTSEVNVHDAPSADGSAGGGGGASLGGLRTRVFSVTLLSASGETELAISGLGAGSELIIEIPRAPGAAAAAAGTADECRSWSEAQGAWTADGCVTLGARSTEESLVCACSHLTDFAGVAVPKDEAEVADQVEAVKVNKVDDDDARTILEPEAANGQIHIVVYCVSAANALCLLLACCLDRRSAKALEAAKGAGGGKPVLAPSSAGGSSVLSSLSISLATTRTGSIISSGLSSGTSTRRNSCGVGAVNPAGGGGGGGGGGGSSGGVGSMRSAATRAPPQLDVSGRGPLGSGPPTPPTTAPLVDATGMTAMQRVRARKAQDAVLSAAGAEAEEEGAPAPEQRAGEADGGPAEPADARPGSSGKWPARAAAPASASAAVTPINTAAAAAAGAAGGGQLSSPSGREDSARVLPLVPLSRSASSIFSPRALYTLDRVASEHPILALFRAPDGVTRRSELVQTLFNTLALEMAVEALIFNADAEAGGAGQRGVGLLTLLLYALLVAAIAVPALMLFRAIWWLGRTRAREPPTERLYRALSHESARRQGSFGGGGAAARPAGGAGPGRASVERFERVDEDAALEDAAAAPAADGSERASPPPTPPPISPPRGAGGGGGFGGGGASAACSPCLSSPVSQSSGFRVSRLPRFSRASRASRDSRDSRLVELTPAELAMLQAALSEVEIHTIADNFRAHASRHLSEPTSVVAPRSPAPPPGGAGGGGAGGGGAAAAAPSPPKKSAEVFTIDAAGLDKMLVANHARVPAPLLRRLTRDLDLSHDGFVDEADFFFWYARKKQLARAVAPLSAALSRCALPEPLRPPLAWLAMLAIYAGLCITLLMLAAALGAEATDAMLRSWAVALVYTFVAQEPVVLFASSLLKGLIAGLTSLDMITKLGAVCEKALGAVCFLFQ